MLQWFMKLARTIAKSIRPRRTAASMTPQPVRHTAPRPERTEVRSPKTSLPRAAIQIQKTAAQPHEQRSETALPAAEQKQERRPAEPPAVDVPRALLAPDGSCGRVIGTADEPKSSSRLAIEPQPQQHQRPEVSQLSALSAPHQTELMNPEPIPYPSPHSDSADLSPAENVNSAHNSAEDLAENADGNFAAGTSSPVAEAPVASANDLVPAFCQAPTTAQNDPRSQTEIVPEMDSAAAVAAPSADHQASSAPDPMPTNRAPAEPSEDAESASSGETAIVTIELPSTRRDEYAPSVHSELSSPESHSALDVAAMPEHSAIQSNGAPVLPSAPTQPQFPSKRRNAVHRDRRGSRRAAETQKTAPSGLPAALQRRPSDLRLRLELDRRAQSALLSAVIARGEGFPDTIFVGIDDAETVVAFNEWRFDDVPLDWNSDLLRAEIRMSDVAQGYSWLHSARTVHIFTDEPGEPDLLTVAAAITGRRHALIVPAAITYRILELTELAGSPKPEILAGWCGIPDGWSVLDGYVPVQAIEQELERELKPLDPGVPVAITFTGGMRIRGNAWAEGSPPEIRIEPLPANATVTIGAQTAEQHADGRWIAPGLAAPGTHVVDVVPGPSGSYTILADPARSGEWNSAPAEKSGTAKISGACVTGANGRPVIALASPGSVTAIGSHGGIHEFARREGYALSSGAPSFEPDFLFVSWGQRRTHGRIVWLGGPSNGSGVPPCARWAAAVRSVAARKLAVTPDTPEAKQAWQRTVAAARNPGRRNAP